MSPLRVLFVDDEPRVLESLRDMFRRRRHDWAMSFANGGRAAIGAIESDRFDVVVTDLRMPDVDGLQVLEHLRTHHPHVVRIVLSGDAMRQTAFKVVPHAHRTLTKPSRQRDLDQAIESARTLRTLVQDETLRASLGRLRALPPLPQTYLRLTRLLEVDTTPLGEIAELVAGDIGLSTKLLQLANSAIFGLGRNVSNLTHAISLLGTETLKTLVLSNAVFDGKALPPHVGAFAEQLHAHSLVVARVASSVAANGECRRDAFAAGLLHDLGRLVYALEASNDFDDDVETGVLRVDPTSRMPAADGHARVGAYLLALWGVPRQIIDCVAEHHDAFATNPVSQAVHLAEELVTETSAANLTDAEIAELAAEGERRLQLAHCPPPLLEERP